MGGSSVDKQASRFGLRFCVNCEALDRFATVHIACCYRTVSTSAALFLAEVPPGDVLAKERGSRTRREQLPERQRLDVAIPGWQPRQSESFPRSRDGWRGLPAPL